ncbi:DUF2207 domain-containing protein [Microbacterium sp.]|uniref:DUF2207 domain-containing protein n=1 Tax=Microbacterium sp. TaxID=51671 RepID=UPI0028119E5A|nr:DUF2207 domain-containing protein [Microbacterium sp.]
MVSRRTLVSFAAVALAAMLFVPTAAAAESPVATDAVKAAASAHVPSDVDDFSYDSWDARYVVGLDDEGRARMQVTETLVARFPDTDQNRGIVRGLPLNYQNAPLETRVVSVTDERGAAVPFEVEEEDDLLLVLTGDDDYVRGAATYVIEYEMSDVILHRDDAQADEFYWDLLPLDSEQPIDSFHAEIVFDEAMSDRLTGSARCYTGPEGSTKECAIAGPSAQGGSAVFAVESGERPAGDGVTVAIGFEPGTAAQPPVRLPDPVTDTVPAIAAAGAVVLSAGAWLALAAFKRRRRTATGIVVAQYEVPDSMPPLLAGAIMPRSKDVISAEIVHLAVRGALRIEEGDGAQRPRLRRLPGVRVSDPLDVKAFGALFAKANAGGVVDIPARSEAFAKRMSNLVESGKKAAEERGLTTTTRSRSAIFVQCCAIAVAVVGIGLSLSGVLSGRQSGIPALVAISVVALLIVMSSVYSFSTHTVLTPAGALAHEHLLGVREFIRVAEADRLRMLQSYTGAERRNDGGADVIHVYELLLPFAMLFGQEKEWGEVLEQIYAREHRGPDWIGDPNSPAVRTPLATFSTSSQSATTYSDSSSSSAGGSFGGGFSGGGGGGGSSGGR